MDINYRELASTIAEYHNRVKCANPFIVTINDRCNVADGEDIRVGDIFYAEYLKITENDVEHELKQLRFIPKGDAGELIEWFYRVMCYPHLGGLSDNRILKVVLRSEKALPHILSNEYNIIEQKHLEQLVETGAYEFIQMSISSKQDVPDNKLGFTFLDEDQRDIYGAALLDGATPTQAWAIANGIKVVVDTEEKEPSKALNGYFRIKKGKSYLVGPTRLEYKGEEKYA